MEFTFSAERKVVFTVQAGGVRRLVEFGERNENGVSSFFTRDPKVASAIRRHSMSRRGIIVETSPVPVEEPSEPVRRPQPTVRTLASVKRADASIKKQSVPSVGTRTAVGKAAAKAAKKIVSDIAEAGQNGEVREFENFTVAREKISREFSIPKRDIRTPTALARAAMERGFSIRYLNAEQS